MPSKKIEFTGSQADLKMGPRNMVQDGFSHGTTEMVGSAAMLSQRSSMMGRFDKHVRDGGGRLQMVGSEADMNPNGQHRGWESYSTPISDNSMGVEERESGFRNGRGK